MCGVDKRNSPRRSRLSGEGEGVDEMRDDGDKAKTRVDGVLMRI
jgi:hypothetical protein